MKYTYYIILLWLVAMIGNAQPIPQVTVQNPEIVKHLQNYIHDSRSKGFLPDSLGIVVLSIPAGRGTLHLMAIRKAPSSFFRKGVIPAYYTFIDGVLVLVRSGFEISFKYPESFFKELDKFVESYYTPQKKRNRNSPKTIKEATKGFEGGVYNGTFIKL